MYFLVYEIYKKIFSSGNLNNLTIITVLAVSAMVTSDVVFTLIWRSGDCSLIIFFIKGVWDCVHRVLRKGLEHIGTWC